MVVNRPGLIMATALLGLYWFAASFFLAKKSLRHTSTCAEAPDLLHSLGLPPTNASRGCWMDRRVDSLVILLVDALRFDFCLYDLPKSVGSRLDSTKLFRFVADPPTVTVQRLKALTTGGLPTFADISSNFGGASITEDTWVQQLLSNNYRERGLSAPSRIAFVGDDTWMDLFPNSFTEAHPYPSFNTRDLDTVDNGCFQYLNLTTQDFEVVVVHFLGVDHVGHTYGPHNQHMDFKLKQIDNALSSVLNRIDQSISCQAALIFGDHGMTQDGNHGGGTDLEISAALFLHTSPACAAVAQPVSLDYSSGWSSFASIHQIDLVPSLSFLLGLPIPYANLGSLVPSLIPGFTRRDTAQALALNAAQVWRYLTIYSQTANGLPLADLERQLQTALEVYRKALLHDDSEDYFDQASILFKHFLSQALELGQRVWTRFDTVGMVGGIVVLAVAFAAHLFVLLTSVSKVPSLRHPYTWELGLALLFMFFLCGALTFSNSYLLEEDHVIMYCMALLSIAIAVRLYHQSSPLWSGVLGLPVAARVHELFVTGHGLDPSLRVHSVHHAFVFLSSLVLLGSLRWYLYQRRIVESLAHVIADCLALLALAGSWWEKRSPDPDRNGYFLSKIALVVLTIGIPVSIYQAIDRAGSQRSSKVRPLEDDMFTILAKVLIAIMAVTGPSTATSLLLYLYQTMVVYLLSKTTGSQRVNSVVLAALWKLVTRHMFFATNHGCGFNRLQYSAAFVATDEFYFASGGISLFINTFGWEMVGIAVIFILSQQRERSSAFQIYTAYQLLEALASCISVSLLRRHLMVWDIFAPHFLFVAIYTALNGMYQLTGLSVSAIPESRSTASIKDKSVSYRT